MTLAEFVLTVMVTVMPPEKHRDCVYETLERYDGIAQAIAKTTDEGPLLFGGFNARKDTALVVAVISYYESGGWQRSVHEGRARGDAGASWCLMQRNIGRGKTPEGWTGPELAADDYKCFRSALNLAGKCARGCRGRRWLNAYGSGSCHRGGKAIALRWVTFDKWRRRFIK